jgi:N-glycosylase/DNA lyase
MQVPRPFDLDLVVRSHGWYDLAPWSWDAERRVLARPLLLDGGRVARAEVAERAEPGGGLAIRLSVAGPLGQRLAAEARRQLRTALALDDDLEPLWRRIRELEPERGRRGLPDLSWAAARGAGRLLRSPTVFEDLVKMLCTTNCSWALTRTMTRNLVDLLGLPAPLGGRAFPTPGAMAARPERFYRDRIRAGYRAPWLRRIAREVAGGRLDVEAWRDPALPTEELAARIRALPGFGPYATEGMLRLLGRHGHLALDSWIRPKLRRLRGLRRQPSDRTIARWYAPYGEWAGLAMWLEVTADWFGDRPAWPPPAAGAA